MFGKGAPEIYVNGRKITDRLELAQINSADIKNVEVITNPGARYGAEVRAVIRIRTKRPQGEGLSGTLRAQNGLRHYFNTVEQFNLKYRTGGLEIFANGGYFGGKFYENKENSMLTLAKTTWQQSIDARGRGTSRDVFGKAGFSYMVNERHSIGAFYSNGVTRRNTDGDILTEAFANGKYYDNVSSHTKSEARESPKHSANIYYNGMVGKLGIDLNLDYIWRKERNQYRALEQSETTEDNTVATHSLNHRDMIAQKLVVSYPVWKGEIEVGDEYTASRFKNAYRATGAGLADATSDVRENNIAAFMSLRQSLGRFQLALGVRYEHVKFDYTENGQLKEEQSKRYNNVFPSLDIATSFGPVQTSVSYSYKTQRPNYSALDGTIDYINRLTLESGNPLLQPEKIHNVQLMGAWSKFFGQVQYSYKKDPILNTTVPYGDNDEVKLITKQNFPHIKQLEAFAGGQFQLGVWYPKVNAGVIKQWFDVEYAGRRVKLDNPIGMVQWQNAIHLPADVWLNVDMQWMSRGNGENVKLSPTSYLNAKLYKAFSGNRLSVTLEANDIFNRNLRDFTFYNRDVKFKQLNHGDNRSFMLTVQYNFNASRDRYRGQGAGNAEKERL